ncbi:sigma-54-dependent Fis family transcriptional regulator [Flavitalea sp.]|nr:sigma 54-interacting transcriptional regulator [Flavitalea sp.]
MHDKEQQQSVILLSLSNEIACVRNREDLLHLIRTTLKQHISFDDSFILRCNKKTKNCQCYILPPEKDQPGTAEFTHQVHEEYFVDDDGATDLDTPLVQDVELLILGGKKNVPLIHRTGIKELLSIKLLEGKERFALFVLLSNKNKSFTTEAVELLEKITPQISIATANLIAREESAKREEENAALISLSNELALLNNRNDLFQVINTKIKKLLSVEEFAIAKIDEGGETYSAFILDFSDKTRKLREFNATTSGSYPVTDPIFKKIVTAESPVLFDVEEVTKQPGMPPYVQFWKEAGFKYHVVAPLRVGGVNTGCLTFDCGDKESIHSKHRLIKVVSAQLAVAVSHILANEKIQAREEDINLLLSLSNDIGALRSRSDLYNIFNTKLKQLFSINEFGIAQINEDRQTYSAFVLDLEYKSKNQPDLLEITTGRYHISDPVFSMIVNAEGPVLFQVNELAETPGIPGYVGFWKRAGIQQVLCVPLRVGGTLIGSAHFHIDTHPAINVKSLLLKGVCAQLAVAVSNILANEEIAKREEEKTVLLSLSNEIATLNSREDLFQVVNTKIKKLLSVEEFGIAQIDEGGDTYSAFVLEFTDERRRSPNFNQVTSGKYSTKDPIFRKVMNGEDPVLFDVEEVAGQPGMPGYVKLWKEAGFKHYLTVPLRVGGDNIGFVNFHCDHKGAINTKSILLKGVCAQLAVAVSNIRANEKIREREVEKTRLLEFSNEMASVRDKQVLAKILKRQLKKLFGVDDYVIHSLSKDKKTHRPILFDPQADFAQHPDFQKLIHADTDINDGVFNKILNSEDLVTFSVEDWLNSPTPPTYTNAAKDINLKTMAGISIRVGQENIAVMNFKREGISEVAIQQPIFKSICSQIAIAIANIIANDEVKGREEEKSMLLDFSNAIASVRDKYIFAKVLKQQLNKLFSIENYVISILGEDGQTVTQFLYDLENEVFKNPAFKKILESPVNVHDGVLNEILQSEVPVTFKVAEWATLNKPPVYLDAALASGLRNLTGLRIRLGDKNIALLCFKTDDLGLPASSLHLLKSICSQIAIAVANIIANEKVNQQLVEIQKYRLQLEEEKIYLREEIETVHNYAEIIGESQEIKKIFRLVSQVAASDSTVLLLGETGTGKELIARAIHNASPRKNKLMIKINCAALPANLVESELFGHERGSFTGAFDRRIGKFELANHSTLFLDEIGEMPLELQVKLLRALQEKEIERLGGKTTIKTDVRIITATNRDLEKLMEEGKFRSDLFYRLNIFPIQLPPLRQRVEDISELAAHFILRFSKKAGKEITTLSHKALQELKNYHWPGNIRELEHLIERSVLLTTGDTIKEIHLPPQKPTSATRADPEGFTIQTIFENEKEYILKVLKQVKGRISGEGGAAELLGIPPSTLSSRMKKLGIRRDHH